jgi:hypothetical protein
MHAKAGIPAIADKINAEGFRRWHEYELTRSFGYLGLGMLALLAGLSVLEGSLDLTRIADRWLHILLAFAGISAAFWSWQRFIAVLATAETLSRQAVCKQCRRYGQLTVLAERQQPAADAGERPQPDPQERTMTCQCKKCGYTWSATYTEEFRRARI